MLRGEQLHPTFNRRNILARSVVVGCIALVGCTYENGYVPDIADTCAIVTGVQLDPESETDRWPHGANQRSQLIKQIRNGIADSAATPDEYLICADESSVEGATDTQNIRYFEQYFRLGKEGYSLGGVSTPGVIDIGEFEELYGTNR